MMLSAVRFAPSRLLIFLCGLLASDAVFADTTTCVNNAAELQAALNTAAASTSTGVQWVQIVQGTYDFSGAQLSAGPSQNNASLLLEGGYVSGCGSKVAGAQTTTLEGVSFFWLSAGTDITVKDLAVTTLANVPPLASGVGMDAPGMLTLDRVRIQGAALDGDDYVTLFGANIEATNLVVGSSNHVNCALLPVSNVQQGGLVFLSHISVAVEQGSGLCLDGWDAALALVVVNSIIETHIGDDDVLVNTAAPVTLQHNIYGARQDISGAQITMDGDTLWGWGVFADASNADLHPAMLLGLPAIDMGDPAADGVTDDILGQPRLNNRPDVGAYESDRIFGATFD